MRRAIIATATAVLVLGGSLVAFAQTSADTDDRGQPGTAIEAVLDDLVADTTLTQEQADAVLEALENRRAEFRAEREQLREQMREQVQEFWADGELTQDEIDQLPEWHRWRQASELLEDGAITRGEMGQMRSGGGGAGNGAGFRHGH